MASLSNYFTTLALALAIFTVKISCNKHDDFNPMINFNNSIQSAMNQLSSASQHFAINGTIETLITNTMPNNALALSALASCRELLSIAMDNLNNSLSPAANIANIQSWLCAAATSLQTCTSGFENLNNAVQKLVLETLQGSIVDTFNSGYIMATNATLDPVKIEPDWLSAKDRRLLQSSGVKPDVVVAKDGSGNYNKIDEALRAVPIKSNKRFVIYVKRGIYHENVKVNLEKWNLMMFGDGMDETIVFSNLSYAGGKSTIDSATFAVFGQGFIARDMGFLNTAGPATQQAVALLSTADQSVFYRCRIEAYQDTLYAHSNRQFYRECHISGTIDFIFGGAAVVIQNSTISARKPLLGQQNTITAHKKTHPHCKTGIVIQKSDIQSLGDLTGVNTYLGRPWSEYSTTVFMQNYMHSLIDPRGWMPWNDSAGAPPPANTIFLAEYNNKGIGANTDKRVKWNGVRVNLSYDEASMYSVQSLINGDQWLPPTSVGYDLGL